MKICPNCQKEYADGVAVCPDDGTFLDLETPAVETVKTATVASRGDEIPHAAESVDRMGTAAAETFERDTEISTATAAVAAAAGERASSTNLYQVDASIDDDYAENPMLGWLLPIVIVILLIILGYWFCGKTGAPTAAATGFYPDKLENKSI